MLYEIRNQDFMSIPALNWIIDYLENDGIPYLVCGGLAAQAYGSTRELADIDIYVPDAKLNQIAEMGQEYITKFPAHRESKSWSLTYAEFEFEGQKVEVCSDKNCRIFDTTKNQWHDEKIDFSEYELCQVYGVSVKVMAKQSLLSYKNKLKRAVDIEDVNQIQKIV